MNTTETQLKLTQTCGRRTDACRYIYNYVYIYKKIHKNTHETCVSSTIFLFDSKIHLNTLLFSGG